MTKIPRLPDIPEQERTPLVVQLLEVIRYQMEIIQVLKDEIAVLKGNKPKPDIKPGKMEKGSKGEEREKPLDAQRPGSSKKSKTADLPIHETIPIKAENVPTGSTFKGYKPFTVQGLKIKLHNTRYLLERWETPKGSYVEGKLPPPVVGHFNLELVNYILYQSYQCHVTQPLLQEQLQEFGIDISSGQINRILVEGNDDFHEEKADILTTGLEISSYIQVDDTGARHDGKNGVCTQIGNELFAYFESTASKSRINFLELLNAGHKDYHINPESLEYMKAQKISADSLKLLSEAERKVFLNKEEWENHIKNLGIIQKLHIKIATEGALVGSILEHGFNPDMVILSDDAGQFNVFSHALCWIHAERILGKIIPFTEDQRTDLEQIREKIWALYKDLKLYKKNPNPEQKIELEKIFDNIFQTNTCFVTLNLALRRLYKNKSELLLVLDRPEIPLHNNGSERDIREYAKRRKISGGTRSDLGRKCRDTFTSLKKTCRKLGISFWEYLMDRKGKTNRIPQLSDLMRLKCCAITSTY